MRWLLLLLFLLPGFQSGVWAQKGGDFQLDIPSKKDLYYKGIKKKARKLGLNKLQKGTRGEEIRIWFEYEMQTFGELVVLKRKRKKWKGYYYRYEEKKASRMHLLGKVTSYKRKKMKPQIGWLSFNRQMKALDVYSLSGDQRSTAYLPNRDGVTYLVEAATRDQYRFFSYWCPDSQEGPEAERMEKITELVREEFRFPVVFVCEPD